MKIVIFEPKDFEVLSMERLQEIKARCSLISSPPWVWVMSGNEKEEAKVEIISAKSGYIWNNKKIATLQGDQSFVNAEFISKAQEDMLHLIAQLEYLLELINSATPKMEEGNEIKAS